MAEFPNPMQNLSDFQAFHRWLDERKGWNEDLNYLVVLLTGELGEVAQTVKKINWKTSLLDGDQPTAMEQYRAALGSELSDCLAYLCKIANRSGVDLHEAYIEKMAHNIHRQWISPDQPKEKEP
jgi:NTP pyrophosphatase (non-canonical NTP hydrolase)